MGKQIPANNVRKLRLLSLAGVAVLIALSLLAWYGRNPDTATLSILGHAVVSPPGRDSTLYMQMGESAFRSGHRIYPELFFKDHQKFIYPPTSLFLIEGLNLLGVHGLSPELVWKIILLLAWAGCVALGVLFYRRQRPLATVVELAAIAVLGILFLPFAEAVYRGQVQILLTLLWELSALLWVRQRKGSSGFVLALTCMFKPQLAIFLLWGALRREWRFTVVFVVTCGVIVACSIAHFGVTNHLDYIPVLSYLSRHGEALWANQSMNGLLNRLLRNGDPVSWSYTIYPPYKPAIYIVSSCFSALLVLAGLLLPWLLGWARTISDFLLFGCVGVLMSPIAWEHHYGYFFLPIVLLLAAADRLPRQPWFVLCACVLAMANRWPPLDHRQRGVVSFAGDYLFFSGILLCCLLCFHASQWATQPRRDVSA
ncbi:MAG TPA: glycosyltransferase family 87 protein [Bryocella sp.]|nr:glycosyltransferase family 87 protein [Bryocella sp.]